MCKKTVPRRRRRWSLVRIFVSFVPEMFWKYILSQPIRPYFNQRVNFFLPKIKCEVCQMQNSPKNFNSFKSYLSTSNNTAKINLNSTPKLELSRSDSRISNIQKDLQQLKDQIAEILKQQREKVQSSDYESLISQFPDRVLIPDVKSKLSPHHKSQPSPPPPPPPPPPLPNNLLFARPTLSVNPKEEKQRRPKPPVEGFPCGAELLRDLRKVQLKKIQKSPGGGPLKKKSRQSSQDPGNFLEKVLKKRFNYIQNISSDASHDSSVGDKNDSFSSDKCQGDIYEYRENSAVASC